MIEFPNSQMQGYDAIQKLSDEIFQVEDQKLEAKLVEENLQQIAELLDPAGTSLKVFENFASIRGIELWPEDFDPISSDGGHSLINLALLIAEAYKLDTEKCHPIRQMIISRELVVNFCSPQNLKNAYGQLGEIFVELSEKLLDKISLTNNEHMQKLRESSYLKQNSFQRKEFLEACMFPLCLPSTMQFTLTSFLQQDIFVNEFEFKDNQMLGANENEWANLSTEPRDLVHFIGTLPSKPTGKIIDWGCGSGSTLFVLDRILSMELSGFDKNNEVIRLANEKATLLKRRHINFYIDDIFNAPVAAGDTIFFYAPLRNKQKIKDFFSSLKERAVGKPITIWSKDIFRFKNELDAQDWLKKGHTAGGITEYKSC